MAKPTVCVPVCVCAFQRETIAVQMPQDLSRQPALAGHVQPVAPGPPPVPSPFATLPPTPLALSAGAVSAATAAANLKLRNFVPSRHLWIGCLTNTTKAKIFDIFSSFGEVEDVSFLKVQAPNGVGGVSTTLARAIATMC